MSAKKLSIEEKMSQSIFYNLSILKRAVKTTPEFDENLSQTMFLKSNTKAFIHITHFLFNIIDPKEFAKKFYWPIVEKKNENSYRTSSVDFINSLIDKHNLPHEKVKLVFVVHPCGKKFISLILSLVILALKEVLKLRRIPPGKSFDMTEVTQAVTNMKDVENDLVNSIKTETKVIKEKTDAIRELMNQKIYPDCPQEFSEFLAVWHEENVKKLDGIKDRAEKMKIIYENTRDMCARAENLLSLKSCEVAPDPVEDVKKIVEFYENVTNDTLPAAIIDEKLNFPWLIAQIHLILPAITSYITSSSFESSENSNEELKVLRRLGVELSKIEAKFDDFSSRFRKIVPEMVEKLKEMKDERRRIELENESPEKTATRAVKEQLEVESLKLLTSPRYYFDTSKECLKNVVVKKNRLALIDEDESKENLNESKYYRLPKSPYANKTLRINQPISNEMGPPKQQIRRRLDPMALLERATSKTVKNRQDLNSSRMLCTSLITKVNKFSSTMLSPDLNHPLFNCSTVSEIRNSPAQCSPGVESMFGNDSEKTEETIPWEDTVRMKTLQMSPKGGLKPLVPVDEIFVQKEFKIEDQKRESSGSRSETGNELPTLKLNDETVENSGNMGDSTLCKEKSLDSSYSMTSMIMKMGNDDDLFNTSDTVLQQLDLE